MARKKGKRKAKESRKGRLLLTDLELMAFRRILDLVATYQADIQNQKEMFARDLGRRHGLPERINLSVDVEERVAMWEERSDGKAKENPA